MQSDRAQIAIGALRGIRVGDILARKFGIYGRVAKALYYQEK